MSEEKRPRSWGAVASEHFKFHIWAGLWLKKNIS